MLKQDYIMRAIEQLVRALAKILLNKDTAAYELPVEGSYTKTDYLHKQLLDLISKGKINEAEDLLFEKLDTKSERYMELALDFYQRLSRLDEGFLEKNNFSREEIEQGLREIGRKFGVPL